MCFKFKKMCPLRNTQILMSYHFGVRSNVSRYILHSFIIENTHCGRVGVGHNQKSIGNVCV